MDHRTLVKVTDSLRKQRSRKRWHKTVGVMGLIVLVATVAALVIPASTLAKEPACGLKEHIHTESCFAETPVLSCGTEEAQAHSHTDACYAESSNLVCGLEESEAHSHSDGCYGTERTLICKTPEIQGHTHSEACYTAEQVLFCEEAEHTHAEGCYEPEKARETVSLEEASASEAEDAAELQGDPAADVESRADWERTISGVTLTGNWAEDVLAIADSQLGYQESSRNFITGEDGKQRGYSRYGAWYGDAYGDWCAMFASFCLHYAQIPTDQMPEEASCPRWIYTLATEKRYASAGKYDPRPGDLIFFDGDRDGISDHVGLVYALDAKKGEIKTIEGNSDDMVQYVTYDLGDDTIMGYGILPENPEKAPETVRGQSYYYEDDTIGAAVTLPEDTEVPADARLRVTAITEKHDDYGTLTEQAESAVSGEAPEIAFYDISFYTEDNEYIPVSERAQVALWFKEPLAAGADQSVEVLYFNENREAPVALDPVKATKDVDDNVSLVTFETPGFSVFAVMTVGVGTDQAAETEPVRVTTEFHGLETEEPAVAENFIIKTSLQELNQNVAYVDIAANKDEAERDVYQYYGKAGKQHQWTVNLTMGEPFVFTETNYQVDGYDCATLITVRYTDGRAVQFFRNQISVDGVKGGEVETISFDNFYTPAGTGMLYIHRYAADIADNILDSALPGADFELELGKADGSGAPVKVTSDGNGTVFFNNLQPNTTYTLKEVKAPEGFILLDGETWTVKVGNDADNVTVEDETGKALYSTTTGINQALNIGNTPDDNTLTVTKRFTGDITAAQVKEMTGYQIVVTGEAGEQYTLTRNGVKDQDGNKAGTVSASDGLFFTWRIQDVTGTDYQVQEMNYLPDSDLSDAQVSVSAAAIELRDTAVGPVTVDQNGVAAFAATLDAEKSDAFAITNNYVDSFTLQVKKVDRSEGGQEIPLSGAAFKVYGPYPDSADSSDQIQIDGETYYYHGTTAETDTDGYVRYPASEENKELKLGASYVLVESKAPAGYILTAEPIATGVVNRANKDYSNGVYTMTVVNSKTFTIEVEKVWGSDKKEDTVTMNLWRSHKVDGQNEFYHCRPETLCEETGWKCQWDVPLYDENGELYTYYVAENYIGGYSTSYNAERETIPEAGLAAVVPLDDVINGESTQTKVIVTNTAGGELPHTGGAGTLWFTFGGLALLMMAIYMFINPRRRREAD